MTRGVRQETLFNVVVLDDPPRDDDAALRSATRLAKLYVSRHPEYIACSTPYLVRIRLAQVDGRERRIRVYTVKTWTREMVEDTTRAPYHYRRRERIVP